MGLPSARRPGRRLASAPLDIVYEDDQLLAVNKPAGVVVHPTYKNAAGTLMTALRLYARQWPAGQRPSLVGRLDKLTSGVLIVAKTAAAHAALQQELGSNRSEKDYLAVVYGRVNAARGIIDLRLGFDGNDRRRMIASADAGLPSVTTFVRVARAGGLSLLRCRLVTGRRHQIRVHLAARGWPIVGDPVYRTPAPNGTPRCSRIRRRRAWRTWCGRFRARRSTRTGSRSRIRPPVHASRSKRRCPTTLRFCWRRPASPPRQAGRASE